MMNPKSHQIIEKYCSCNCEERFIWPRIKATNGIPMDPPEIVPEGMIIPTIQRYFISLQLILIYRMGQLFQPISFGMMKQIPLLSLQFFHPMVTLTFILMQ